MKITNEFTVHTPIDRAWEALTDLEGIAPCMPGAQLTGVDGDVYRGKVKVKVGPVISEFAGTAQFTEKDESAYRAVIDAKGRDARSAGNAAALVTAVLSPSGDDSTLVSVDTDLKISGKLAQFGSGMIKEVSSKLLTQFVTNLEAKLATDAAAASSPPPSAASASAASAVPGAAGASAASAETTDSPAESATTTASAAAVETAPDTSVSPAAVDPTPSPAASDVPIGHALNGRAPTSAAAAVATPAAVDSGVAPASSSAATAEAEPLDLLELAGGSIYKRLIPVAVGAVVVGAVIAWVVARR
ncbi:SRPBCC family protein [Paractinoplanes atraurantiacus]|uniref:Carbon monoxide dehydrogenase subunit G n=1 Tax=Paractinoplanes atraurantiacus TaxID=1036182 RepID=A0A285J2K2_9ACTN|nr:SRPBCC family protein [Actinoplanes atraurantiacus]SNY54432.1 Carbon monoxide dehydrogenase subunit G [Actinoplanes atraurantiacus]